MPPKDCSMSDNPIPIKIPIGDATAKIMTEITYRKNFILAWAKVIPRENAITAL